MEIKDWRVLKCTRCGNTGGAYYAPPLPKDKELKYFEKDMYESDYQVKVTDNGMFEKNCDCGGTMKEVDPSEWPLNVVKEVIGSMMEDDNRHSLVKLGHAFDECMKKAGIFERQRTAALVNFMRQYDTTGSVCNWP